MSLTPSRELVWLHDQSTRSYAFVMTTSSCAAFGLPIVISKFQLARNHRHASFEW
jgi:hypothetical protein